MKLLAAVIVCALFVAAHQAAAHAPALAALTH